MPNPIENKCSRLVLFNSRSRCKEVSLAWSSGCLNNDKTRQSRQVMPNTILLENIERPPKSASRYPNKSF